MGEAKAKQNCSPSSSLPTSSQQVLVYLQPRQISNITSMGYCLVISYGSGARLVDGFSFLAVLLRQYKNFGKVLMVSLCCDRKSALCISRVKFSHLPFRKDFGPSLITPGWPQLFSHDIYLQKTQQLDNHVCLFSRVQRWKWTRNKQETTTNTRHFLHARFPHQAPAAWHSWGRSELHTEPPLVTLGTRFSITCCVTNSTAKQSWLPGNGREI